MRKKLFNICFLKQDISLNNIFKKVKVETLIDTVRMEGIMSQIFHIGLRFDFMKCRK